MPKWDDPIYQAGYKEDVLARFGGEAPPDAEEGQCEGCKAELLYDATSFRVANDHSKMMVGKASLLMCRECAKSNLAKSESEPIIIPMPLLKMEIQEGD